MALKNPPFNDNTITSGNRFSAAWNAWLRAVVSESRTGYSGSFTDGDGNTVVVKNGKITSVS